MICIYHSVDLDGWCSAAIVKMKYPEVKLIGYNYGEPIPKLPLDETIIMVDISFPVNVMADLYGNGDLIWIDHHISAINDMGEGGTQIKGLRDTKFAACELTWKYFFPDILRDPMPEFVRLLGRYDCFGHKGTSEEETVLLFQYAARAYYKSPEDCYNIIFKWNEWDELHELYKTDGYYPGKMANDFIREKLNQGHAIYTYLCTEAQQIYSRRFVIDFDGYKFAAVNAPRFNPINFGIKYHEDGYDGAACFHYEKGQWLFSLYNDDGKVDVSEICKKRGGGGHKGAAGFRTNDISIILK